MANRYNRYAYNYNGVGTNSVDELLQMLNNDYGGFGNMNINTTNTLNDAMFKNAYAQSHPIKSGVGKITGKGSGYSPLGTTANVVGDAAIDAGVDKIFGGTSGKIPGKLPNATPGTGGLKGFWSKSVKPNFGWSKSKGLKAFGKNLGGWTGAGTVIPGIMAGVQALGNVNALEDANRSTEDLLGDIMASANSNPIVNSYLSTDQRSLLRDIKNGKFDPEEFSLDTIIPDDLGGLLDIGKGALTGIAGGIPGMIVGGIGGAVNSGLEDAISKAGSSQAELEALLFALQDAEAQYQSMKRPNFTGLGIQQRYQDMYR